VTDPQRAPEADIQREFEALLEFLYLCPLAVAQLDGDGLIEMMNPMGAQILAQLGGPVTENLFDMLAPFASDLRAAVSGLTADQGILCEARRLEAGLRARTAALPLVLSLTLIKLRPGRMMAVMADISRSAAQERAARAAEDRFRAVLDGVRDYAIVALDRQGIIESWNKSAERIFGYAPAEVSGRSCAMLYTHDADVTECVKGLLDRATSQGWAEDEGWWVRKETSRFWGNAVYSVLENEDGSARGFVVVIRDLTRRKGEEDALRELASTDSLTGAANRRHLAEVGATEVSRWRRTGEALSVVIFDADHFKGINDTYGHATGDEVLKLIARTCRDQVRDLDLVARIGGEEFAVLLTNTDAAGARAAAERIRIAVEAARLTRGGQTVRFTVSAGVAELTRGMADLDAVLQAADAALYEAKRRGRNRTVASTVTARAFA
jgi:diguanylate cyclase (GGDEF)-like protein/PAS domain S-box-containing protein